MKFQALVDCNVGFIVNLMFADDVNSAGQRFTDYRPALEEIAHKAGRIVCLAQMPIRDNKIPTPKHMRRILDLIDSAIAAGEVVFVHCWGGKERTGTVIGCYLARHGLAGFGKQVLTFGGHVGPPNTAAWKRRAVLGSRSNM